MLDIYFHGICLQLFGEGTGGDGGTGSGGNAAEGSSTAESNIPQFVPKSRALKNAMSQNKTVYGKQAEESPTEAGSQPTEIVDRAAKFEELIKGEYKDLYDQRVQETLQKRFKGNAEQADKVKQLEAQLAEQKTAMQLMANRYSLQADENGNFDTKALTQAIEDDESMWEEEALREGLSVQQLKSIRKLEAENASLKAKDSKAKAQEEADRMVAMWQEQEIEAKKFFPELDLKTEIANPQFVDLLKRNIDVKAAYQVVHFNDLVSGAMRTAAQNAENKITQKVISNGSRPTENGNSSQGAAIVKSDVSQLSKADRQEIIRRVQRGEKITF